MQGGLPILAAFDLNADFDGDEVHKATSIHLQVDVQSMLDGLPETATVYIKNRNKLETVGATNNLRGLAASIKFISDKSVTPGDPTVKDELKSSRSTTDDFNVDVVYSSRMSAETRAALNDYKAQQDAMNKAAKALYDQERKDIYQQYQKKINSLEASYIVKSAYQYRILP